MHVRREFNGLADRSKKEAEEEEVQQQQQDPEILLLLRKTFHITSPCCQCRTVNMHGGTCAPSRFMSVNLPPHVHTDP